MGTQREVMGRFVVVMAYRKNGNGAKGAKMAKTASAPRDKGRLHGTGKRAEVYQKHDDKDPELLAFAEGPTGKEALQQLRKSGYIPTHVAVNNNGTTHF